MSEILIGVKTRIKPKINWNSTLNITVSWGAAPYTLVKLYQISYGTSSDIKFRCR
jgi:cell division protein FtsW (lipid II flippase)